ncbi:MAG: SigF/SigG family RNA polymerase sporulation sigma factor [Lachnospiraceae bacterium]|nr:SigF/SigG family RNA polymerase sporulation sigma factor [Robinsoniella sp.]MDY3767894.1 SigF/SigG family RNA polymerase sporulation sigma factor [Lachnospiraceae bacterium]
MEDTLALIRRAHEGDKDAREQLISENMGLVFMIGKRFLGRGYEMEDLCQIGSIGLMKAIDKFDPSFEVKFSTYAVPMIAGELKRFLRDDGMIKVSRSLKEISYKVYQTREILGRKLRRDPTIEEMAQEMKMEREEIVMALEASTEVESLSKTIYQGDGTAICLMDRLEEKENENEKVLDRILLEQLLGKLDREEYELIYLRYFEERTQMQVAEKMGKTQVQVSRMEKKILAKLRQEAG